MSNILTNTDCRRGVGRHLLHIEADSAECPIDEESPHALDNLPPLDGWTNEALVRDLVCNVQEEATAGGRPDMGPDTVALRDEILRRMADGRSYS